MRDYGIWLNWKRDWNWPAFTLGMSAGFLLVLLLDWIVSWLS